MPRLFVALRPPDEVLDLVEALPRPAEPGVRYTTRDQWHVTLRFLGDAEVSSAVAALDDLRAGPVDVVLGPRVRRLGRGSSAGGVVVVPVAGVDGLAASIGRVTATIGAPPDPRPFTGHLTIARVRRRGTCRIAGAAIAASFTADEVQLVRSHLGADGARYQVVARRRLGAPGSQSDHQCHDRN